MLNIELFKEKAKNIHEKGDVKARGKGTSQIGITYELLLGKEPENFEIPDFWGIEIKTLTKNHFLYQKIVLFRAVPDSYLFEMHRLISNYGVKNEKEPHQKNLYIAVTTLHKNKLKNGYQFRLVVDRKAEELVLVVYDKDGIVIDTNARWSFELLKEKLIRKLSYLAFVKAEKKTINGEVYFAYDLPKLYHLKGFETFLNLIELGAIALYFNVGLRNGKTHDHGTGFIIHPNKIPLLFDSIPFE